MSTPAKPLPKELHDRCVAAGITQIHLNFHGGGDEGFVDVSFIGPDDSEANDEQLKEDFDEWGLDAYDFTGDGNDHGMDVCYDLNEQTVTISDWWLETTSSDDETTTLTVDNE